jgi:hypothetical protein
VWGCWLVAGTGLVDGVGVGRWLGRGGGMPGLGSVGMMDGRVDGRVREVGGGVDVGGVGRLDFVGIVVVEMVGIVDFGFVEIECFDSVVVAVVVAAGSGDSDSVAGTVAAAVCYVTGIVGSVETEDSEIEVGIVDLD